MEKQTHRYFSVFVRAISRDQFKHEMEVTQLKLSGIADEKSHSIWSWGTPKQATSCILFSCGELHSNDTVGKQTSIYIGISVYNHARTYGAFF